MKNEVERSETWMKKKTVSDSSMAMMLKKKKGERDSSFYQRNIITRSDTLRNFLVI